VTPRHEKPRNYVCTLCSQYEQICKPAGIPLVQLEMTNIFKDEIEERMGLRENINPGEPICILIVETG